MASFSSTSDEVMAQVAWKKQVTHAKKLFETTTQAPSPSKDYVHILVTERGVIHRRFPITLRGVSQGAIPTPTEKIMTLEDFVIDADFQNEIGRTFGRETLDQVKRAAGGNWDIFLTLHKELVIRIISLLDLESITHLSQVNRHMREICNSSQLWKVLYIIHQDRPNDEISALAEELGWKEVFFMNKLQLQKEISRRRKVYPKQHEPLDSTLSSPDSTFLTET